MTRRPPMLDPLFETYYPSSDIHISPTALWSCVAGGVLVLAYLLHALCLALDYPFLLGFELLWNAFVWLMPSSLVLGLRPTLSTKGSGSSEHAAKSEVLRNVFKLDRLRSLSVSTSGSVRGDTPPGLGNWDNSCYQNSVLQALASVQCLGTFFEHLRSNILDLQDDTTIASLGNLLGTLNDDSNSGRLLWTPHRLKSMSSWQQQDAQEYFSRLVDDIEKETIAGWKRNRPVVDSNATSSLVLFANDSDNCDELKSSTDMVVSEHRALQQLRNPIEGLIAQRVGCIRCGFSDGLSLLPFNCLTLPLGRSWSYDVRQCLEDYTALEYIEGVECPKCSLVASQQDLQRQQENVEALLDARMEDVPEEYKEYRDRIVERLEAIGTALEKEDFSDSTMKRIFDIPRTHRVTTTKSKQVMVMKPPECLVLHLNRSLFDEYTGAQLKNYADIEYQSTLDLSRWCVGNPSEPLYQDNKSTSDEWEMDPTKSMQPKDDNNSRPNPQCRYKLRAVITHLGRHENGHYVCYRKLPLLDVSQSKGNTEVWWRLSDEKVARVDEEEALSQGSAFMLFYERTDDYDDIRQAMPLIETPIVEVTEEELQKGFMKPPDTPSSISEDSILENSIREESDPVEISVEEQKEMEKPGVASEQTNKDSDLTDPTPESPVDTGPSPVNRSYSPLPSTMRTAGPQQHTEHDHESFTAGRPLVAT